ncbi:MAG: hypothetical protein AAFY71_14665 [Bacteroidota bacterium]
MSFIVRGNLCGYVCEDCREPLFGSIVRLYRLANQIGVSEAVVADPKNTLQLVKKEHIEAKSQYLIGEGKIDEEGNFESVLTDEFDNYRGPIMVDVFVPSVPGQQSREKEGVQFTITILQPRWQPQDNDLVFNYQYCLSARFWCYIRSLFDAWVICGRLMTCGQNSRPIVGATVTAFDADWLKDDEIGSATTDGEGKFRIDYSSIDFKQTFLSPYINVETPFPPYNSGPDVYFKAYTTDGGTILEESRSDGKQAGRENIGNCFCIDLCGEFEVPVSPVASAWLRVGDPFYIHSDFDALGYAGTAKYAMTGTIDLNGQVAVSTGSKPLEGNPIEYRFMISPHVTGINGASPIAASNFTKIVGVDTGLLVSAVIGEMFYPGNPLDLTDPARTVPIKSELDDFDSEGWFDVNKAILRTFTDDASLNVAELSTNKWQWIDHDRMMTFDSKELTDNSMPSISGPGESIPTSSRKATEKIAIRLEIREVIDKASNIFNYLPANGQTLNAMFINNTQAVREFNINELAPAPCSPLSGGIAASFTAHHPHLQAANINITSNDGAIDVNLTGDGLQLSANTNDSINHLSSTGLSVTGFPNNVALKTCTYIATFRIRRRLHTNHSPVSAQEIVKAFYYEAS